METTKNYILRVFREKKLFDNEALFKDCKDELKMLYPSRLRYMKLFSIIITTFIEVLRERLIQGNVIRTPLRDNIWISIVMVPLSELKYRSLTKKEVILYGGVVPLCTFIPRESIKKFCGYKRPVVLFTEKETQQIRDNVKNGKSYVYEHDLSL